MTEWGIPAPFRIAFADGPDDYLSALSRLRWRREFESSCAGLAGTLDVFDPRSLPAPDSGPALAAAATARPTAEIFPADSAAGEANVRWAAPAAATLREFEGACAPAPEGFEELPAAPRDPPARFRPTGSSFSRVVLAAGFRVMRVPESFGVREEILALVPRTASRLLDIGCGAAETAGEARKRIPGLRVTGIDRHPALLEAARERLDELVAGDAIGALSGLEAKGTSFDTILLADFLEHVPDPYRMLRAALRLAEPGATVIVSVPNASCIPLLEDLLLGRFDPIGAGIEDAGHLRWFTRTLLAELLEAAGLRDIRTVPVPAPFDGSRFLERLRASGIAHREDDLCAVQWLATARL